MSNLFTGDAERSFLTMSRAKLGRSDVGKRRTFAGFLTDPQGFMRALVRTIAEIVKERFQARRQVRRDLVPRVHRGWTFAALRAATNVLGRDLNTAIITEEMRKGTRSIYVDYVDYDEIAHHAGIFRPESLAALDGLDRVLGTLERLAESRRPPLPLRDRLRPRPVAGAGVRRPLRHRPGDAVRHADEGAGRVGRRPRRGLGPGRGSSPTTWARRASPGSSPAARPTWPHRHLDDEATAADADISVLGSGNLGLLYVHQPTRLTLDDLAERWPALVPGPGRAPGRRASWPGSTRRVARGRSAARAGRDLDTGEVQGVDPLAPYGEAAARLLCRAVLLAEAPDLYMNSTVDADTLDIAAFEPLVGAHGGLGGWQDRAVLLVPKDLAGALPDGRIEGADHLHRVLVGMLESVGQRTDLKDPV